MGVLKEKLIELRTKAISKGMKTLSEEEVLEEKRKRRAKKDRHYIKKLKFGKGLSILVGPNGGGKTTLLASMYADLVKVFFSMSPLENKYYYIGSRRTYIGDNPKGVWEPLELRYLRRDGSNLPEFLFSNSMLNIDNRRDSNELSKVLYPIVGKYSIENIICLPDGIADLIFLATVLFYLPKDGILFADNIDCNMHSTLQEYMVKEVIEKFNKQVILATHSHHITNMCSPEQVFMVSRNPEDKDEMLVRCFADVPEAMSLFTDTETTISDIVESMESWWYK